MEIWDFQKQRQVAQYQSPDTTHFQWCADGAHFITATTSPRLRVGNGYRLWHFKGKLKNFMVVVRFCFVYVNSRFPRIYFANLFYSEMGDVKIALKVQFFSLKLFVAHDHCNANPNPFLIDFICAINLICFLCPLFSAFS